MAIRQGKRPGDRRVRAERVRPQSFRVDSGRVIRKPPPQPAVVLAVSFLGLIVVGTLLLMLPVATADGSATDLVTALFTATSAVCVTGLVVVDTGTHWSTLGQLVILGLVSLTRIAVREFPEVDPVFVSVSTDYRGAGAAIVENKITQVIEDRIAGLEGIEALRSSSRDGRSDGCGSSCCLASTAGSS